MHCILYKDTNVSPTLAKAHFCRFPENTNVCSGRSKDIKFHRMTDPLDGDKLRCKVRIIS